MPKRAYYNENQPYAAAWIRNLITAGLIPDGEVDERSIVDVQPDDLRGYGQLHLFAGMAGWPLALRLAGWSDLRSVLTGSAPCQPFSVAGKRAGIADPRHLWPHMYRIIRGLRPVAVFGEQVSGKAGYGWFDGVQSDMEAEGYTCGAFDIPACSVNAPIIRNRLYWVAEPRTPERWSPPEGRGDVTHGADPGREKAPGGPGLGSAFSPTGVAEPDSGNGFWWSGPLQVGWNTIEGEVERGGRRYRAQWRIKPGVPLLALGIPSRVAKLCALGNAIVAPLAAEVIKAYMETHDGPK